MNTDAVGKAVQDGNRRFGAAVKSKDYGSLAALYTEDAKLLPPDAPIITGRTAIKDFWTTAAAALELQNVTLKTLDLDASQDTAWEIGEALLELRHRPHDGQIRRDLAQGARWLMAPASRHLEFSACTIVTVTQTHSLGRVRS